MPSPGDSSPRLRVLARKAHALRSAKRREAARFRTHRPELVRSFRLTAHPDEAFFQTILMSSPLARTIVDDDLRYIDHPYGHASPRVLASSDLGALLESEALFARKFDPRVDARVLDTLDAHIDAQAATLAGGAARQKARGLARLYTDSH